MVVINSERRETVEVIVLLNIFIEILAPMLPTLNISHFFMETLRVVISFGALLILTRKGKRSLFDSPMSIYLIWTVYVFIKNLILGYGVWGSPMQMYSGFVTSSICVFSSLYAYRKNEFATLITIIISLYIFSLYSLFFVKFGSTSYVDDEVRLGGDLLNANAVGIRASLLFFFIIILFLKGKISLLLTVSLLILPFFVIISSGSRTAFTIMALFFSIIIFKKNKGTKAFLGNLGKVSVLLIAFYAYEYIMNYTLLGERFIGTSEQAATGHLHTGTFWDIFGDRGYQYYVGLPHLFDNFLFGLGSGNGMNRILELTTVFHSEYLIQLIENGFIAAIMYFYVYYWIIRNAIKLKPRDSLDKTLKNTIIITMIALLFTCFVTRVSYYGMYSCVIAYLIYSIIQIKECNLLKKWMSNK